MKPPPFDYHAPHTVEEVVELLAEHGDDAKVLAGGQSYIPAMSFRLARPEVLIDLNGVAGLAHIEPGGGVLRIGAMTRQRTAERDPRVAERAPLLAATLPHVAHVQIRNRGTVGGSIAHADPAAELPAVLLALGGRCKARGPTGDRWIAADDFFTGLFETALEADELLLEVELPAIASGDGWAFAELSRRHGDYSLVGAAAWVSVGEDHRCERARLAFLSVGEGPVLATSATALTGTAPSEEAIRAVAAPVAGNDIDPPADIHASSAYRRHLAEVLSRRVLSEAFARALDT